MKGDPQLSQTATRHQGKLCFPYTYGVVFTNITRRQWDAAISEEEQERILPAHRVIFQDEMLEKTDSEVFQQQLWDMFEHNFGSTLSVPQIDRIRWHLFPEVRIGGPSLDLFDNESDEALPETLVPDIIRIMDIQQEQLARSLGSGHRIIHGVAGSGKTLILGYRCLYLAQTVQKAMLNALSERDPDADICLDAKGNPEPDANLRDFENVPMGESVFEYFEREVTPHVPDAWIDKDKRDALDGCLGIVGFEIPFNRHFYQFKPPRPLDEIDADLKVCTDRIKQMIEGLSA